MKPGRNRHGRTDHPRGERARAKRAARPARGLLAAALLVVLALLPAQAGAITGGASPVASSNSVVGAGLAFAPMRTAGATWYGPGLYGNRTACGRTLRPRTLGVAHRSLPCGTAVKFRHRGRAIVVRVIDRGPYAAGYSWDLTNGARRLLDFEGAGPIRYAVERRRARR